MRHIEMKLKNHVTYHEICKLISQKYVKGASYLKFISFLCLKKLQQFDF